jgi:hypothetical protein
VIVAVAASLVVAEPPSNYQFSQPIHHQHYQQQPQQYDHHENHHEIEQFINPTSNIEIQPSRERYLVQRAAPQQPKRQAPKKTSNQQSKFRRNPQPVEVAPQRQQQQQVPTNAARFQNQKKPATVQQKPNVRVVKEVPTKVYREAPLSSYGVPSSYQPPAPAPAVSYNENAQSSGYESAAQSGGDDEGYNYEKPASASAEYSASGNAFGEGEEFSYEAQDVGENSQDGLKIDEKLLELIRDVLIEEENINLLGPLGESNEANKPFPKYGPPEDKPAGPPKVTSVELDDTVPSIQVAQYLGLPSKFSQSSESGVASAGASVSSESSGGFEGYHYKQRFF